MNDVDELVRRLEPTFRVPPPSAGREALLHAIVGSSTADKRRVPWFRRFAVLIPVTGAIAALVFGLVAILPGTTPAAQALEIIQRDGYLEVRILDAVADPQRYRDEFAKHGLNIELTLAPAGAEQVGRLIFEDLGAPGIETIEAPGDCTANGNCSVGMRIPVNYASYARFVFGRTPLPGESVAGDAPVLTDDEERWLRSLVGKRVSEMREILASQGWTPDYRVGLENRRAGASEVPDDWFVTDIEPLHGKVAVVWVDARPTR
ncbi:hypothetical protein [Allorhizocola rhizosphaerae]|uniref:hypothetical protein n=1 Tax=Allorhizocola rhizosphaerae TaxID=1872709 RepID=UPI000E3D014B|nr:hypothetical protein [Allorhizocola rhizosphaerae]